HSISKFLSLFPLPGNPICVRSVGGLSLLSQALRPFMTVPLAETLMRHGAALRATRVRAVGSWFASSPTRAVDVKAHYVEFSVALGRLPYHEGVDLGSPEPSRVS